MVVLLAGRLQNTIVNLSYVTLVKSLKIFLKEFFCSKAGLYFVQKT